MYTTRIKWRCPKDSGLERYSNAAATDLTNLTGKKLDSQTD